MHLAQTLCYFQKIMLAISTIWLCLFFENALILNKMPILGQPTSNQTQCESNKFSLYKIQLCSWLLLLIMTGISWLLLSPFMVKSIVIGGVIANISFTLLKRDLTRLLSDSLAAIKIRFFIKYYIRLLVVVLVLFLLMKYQLVHAVALLLGMSTVLISIALVTIMSAKKIYSTTIQEGQ